MILDSGNQSFDQQKTKRELTGGRLIYFVTVCIVMRRSFAEPKLIGTP